MDDIEHFSDKAYQIIYIYIYILTLYVSFRNVLYKC